MSAVTDAPARPPARHRRTRPSVREQLQTRAKPLVPRTRRTWIVELVGLIAIVAVVTTLVLTTFGGSQAAATAKPPAAPAPAAASPEVSKVLSASSLQGILPAGWQAIPACVTPTAAGCEGYKWTLTRPTTDSAAMQLKAAWTAGGFSITTAACQRETKSSHAACQVKAEHGIGGTNPMLVNAEVTGSAVGQSTVTIDVGTSALPS